MSALRAITNLSRLTISHPPGDGLFLFASTAAKKTPTKYVHSDNANFGISGFTNFQEIGEIMWRGEIRCSSPALS